jgi:hypothetical protein
MKLTLPRPYAPARRITFHESLALDTLRAFAGPEGIGNRAHLAPVAIVSANLQIPADHAAALLSSLESRRIILLTESDFAISSRLSKALKNERDRNRQRALNPATNNSQVSTPPDWTLHQRARQLFPCLRARMDRPASYTVPAAFAPLLASHEHFHKKDCPPDVEILTEACYPGELSSILTMIEEQLSAHRHPVLLYTRKAIYLGIRRAAKR